MRVAATGASGVLGTAVCTELERLSHEVIKTDLRPADHSCRQLDICNRAAVQEFLEASKPEVLLHLAAETDLDLCERDPERAHRINVDGTANVAEVCAGRRILMVYVGTGGVFDGLKHGPYLETDEPGPVNVYAQTKLAGERIVQKTIEKHFILRTTWLTGGGANDRKFVGRIVNLVRNNVKEIRAVSDIVGSPTFAEDFARNLLPVIGSAPFGLYHMSNKGGCSRFELARKIVEFMGKAREIPVYPVPASEFPTTAPRPRSELLRNRNLELLGLDNMPTWEESLLRYVRAL